MIEKLLAGFPYTTKEEWFARINKDLKGKTVEDMLWSPDDDLQINPYIHSEEVRGFTPPLSTFGRWAVGESFEVNDEMKANQQLHEALRGGTESLRISCTDRVSWEKLLNGVELPLIHIGLHITGDAQQSLSDFFVYAEKKCTLQELRITLYSNSFSTNTTTRSCLPPIQSEQIVNGLAELIGQILDFTGGDPSKLEKQDVAVEISMHYLVEIARLRALRMLWQNIATVKGFNVSSLFALDAYTTPFHTNEDVYSDMIRNTIMCVAAVVGGADRVYICPASGSQHSESFYRRIARNVHHILRYECKFTEIVDPIAGAFYVDRLSQEIFTKTWERLKNFGHL